MSETPFVLNDEGRYSRLELIGWWDQQRLRNARVLVVGAGALGNEVLKNLALVGIGHVTIIDFDTVENSNLSRSVLFRAEHSGQPKATVAAAGVRQLNPDVEVVGIHGNALADIGLGTVRGMDLVIGCLDNREARLWVNRMCWKVNRPWIDGGIQEINGVAKVFQPPDGACYECGMTDADYRLIQLRYSCPLLRREDMLEGKVPTAPTVASIIAGLQVQEALKLLHGLATDAGSALVFNGVANQFYKTSFQHREDCLSHETWEPVVAAPFDRRASLATVSAWMQRENGVSISALQLDRDLVIELSCERCRIDRPVMRARPVVAAAEGVCEQCGEAMAPRMEHNIDIDSPLAEMPLSQLGVPDREILHLVADGESFYVELQAESGG